MTERPDEFDSALDGFPTFDDPDGRRSRQPIEILATQFVEEIRAGGTPSIEAYARRYAKLADQIRDYFPMLQLLERGRIEKETASLRHNMPERFTFGELGGCRLVREVGRGGMGVVFEAVEEESGQRVAVKLLPWRISAAPQLRDRFRREAQVTSQLRHRHIVPVHRFGEQEGYCFFVMHFVDGVGLDRVIARLRETDGLVYADEIRQKHSAAIHDLATSFDMPVSELEDAPADIRSPHRRLRSNSWRRFAQIGVQAAQALHAAHEQGTLHNDIKPANLLLDADGKVWVSDFGLAGPLTDQQASHAGSLTGTLRYMSPERLDGHRDVRSDVYSLGVTLYELVTLTSAFNATTREELIDRILTGERPAPTTVNPSVPPSLEAVILQATSVDPAKRHASAAELAAALLATTRQPAETDTPPGLLARLRRPFRRE